MSTETTGEAPDIVEARLRAGQAIRRLGHTIIGRHAAADVLHRVATALESAAAELDRGGRRMRSRGSWGYESVPDIAHGEVIHTYPDRPYSGHASPLAVDMAVVRTATGVESTVVLDAAHEGAPERSHGGVVAAIFDDLTGFVLQVAKARAYTGELTVRYEGGFPIGVPIRFEAWLVRQEGRKLFIDAEAHADGTRLATCRTIYITV